MSTGKTRKLSPKMKVFLTASGQEYNPDDVVAFYNYDTHGVPCDEQNIFLRGKGQVTTTQNLILEWFESDIWCGFNALRANCSLEEFEMITMPLRCNLKRAGLLNPNYECATTRKI